MTSPSFGLQWAFKLYYLSVCLSTIGIKDQLPLYLLVFNGHLNLIMSPPVGLQCALKTNIYLSVGLQRALKANYLSVCWSTKGIQTLLPVHMFVYNRH